MIKEALLQTPVFMTFFVRHKTFSKVFDSVRSVRPAILFLASDGPRQNSVNDLNMIAECRKIVEEGLDWNCTVYRLYADANVGLLKNTFDGLRFAFTKVDSLIFLEDDILPNLSFFYYCQELLTKYLHDHRIHMICGMNHLGTYNRPNSDYFFSQKGSIWGFGIWKRTFDQFDTKLTFLSNPYAVKLLRENAPKMTSEFIFKQSLRQVEKMNLNDECIDFELLGAITMYLNNSTLIIPSKNMITCLGVSEHAAHNVDHPKKLPSVIRRLFNQDSYNLSFPLRHPKYFARDFEYENEVSKIMGKTKFILFFRRVESYVRRLIYA